MNAQITTCFAVYLRREEGERRRTTQHRPHVQVLGSLLRECAVFLKQRFRILEREHDEPAERLRPERMQLKLELGHDAEVAAAAAERPEEVGIFICAGPHVLAVSGDDFRGDEVVDRSCHAFG